jgi:PAS domain S-box-containing protein
VPAAPIPQNEADRLLALHSLGVLDTPAERVYDDLTSLAAELLGVPIAVVSLVDANRQWFKSCVGLGMRETPRDAAFCAHAILGTEPLVIEDATADPRTSDSPLVTGAPGIRFYAGIPLVLSSGAVVGTLCAIDTSPRTITPAQLGQVVRLARVTADALEVRLERESKIAAQRELRSVLDASLSAVLGLESVRDERTRIVDFRIGHANRAAGALAGIAAEQLCGRRLLDVLPGLRGGEVPAMLAGVVDTGEPGRVETDYADDRRSLSLRCAASRLGDGAVLSADDVTEARQSERRLAASHALMRQFVEDCPVSVAMLDRQQRFLIASERFCREHGVDRADVLGMGCEELLGEIGDRIRGRYARVLRGANFRHDRDRLHRPDGSTAWVRWSMHPWHDETGAVGGATLFTEDISDRVQQELVLERQRTLLEQTERVSGVAGWSYEVAGANLYWTPEVYTIHEEGPGHTPSVATALAYYTPESRPIIESLFGRAVSHGEPFDTELEIVTAKGRTRPVRAVGVPILEDGRVVHVAGSFQDLTAARASREERDRTLSMLHAMSEGASDQIFVKDIENRFLFVNPAFARFVGRSVEEITGLSDADVLSPDVLAVCRQGDAEAIQSGRLVEIQEVIHTPSGPRYFVTSKQPYRLSDGRIVGVIGVSHEVTDIRRSLDRLETALVAARQGLWEWSLLDNLCYFDEQWYRVLGYEPGELPAEFKTWEGLCHPDDLGPAKQALGDYLSGRTSGYAIEHRLWTKQRGWKWVLGACTITERDAEGRPTRVVGVNVDVDERREAQLSAERANAAKSQFLANMSHEIRTPMTSIVGYADLLCTDEEMLESPARRREIAQVIQRNGRHLLALINDILDISKIEAGKLTVEALPVSIVDVVSTLRDSFTLRAQSKSIGFEVVQETPMPAQIVTDAVRFRQIVDNLLSNAMKFTDQGRVTLALRSDGRSVSVEVADTGIGMTEEQLARLFRPFQQADASMTRRYGGTGLGLSISRHLAELLGGSLSVVSTPGVGSRFTLVLPTGVDPQRVQWVSIGGRAEAPAETPASVAASLQGRILLVEDGRDNQRLIAHLLRRAGAEVEIADDGQIAIDAIAESVRTGRVFDLVLMDMQMPVKDGYTAAAELRAGGFETPIVALTAHAMSDDRDRCLAAGCDDFETKPVTRDALLRVCGRWIGKRSSRSAA